MRSARKRIEEKLNYLGLWRDMYITGKVVFGNKVVGYEIIVSTTDDMMFTTVSKEEAMLLCRWGCPENAKLVESSSGTTIKFTKKEIHIATDKIYRDIKKGEIYKLEFIVLNNEGKRVGVGVMNCDGEHYILKNETVEKCIMQEGIIGVDTEDNDEDMTIDEYRCMRITEAMANELVNKFKVTVI